MGSNAQPHSGRVVGLVVAFALYCAAGSALLSHLVANVAVSDAAVVIPTDTGRKNGPAAYAAHEPLYDPALESRPVMVAIGVHDGSTLLCETTPNRVASDVIQVDIQDVAALYVDLRCNQQH